MVIELEVSTSKFWIDIQFIYGTFSLSLDSSPTYVSYD